MFYDVFSELCEEKRIKPSKAAEECGINKSNVSNWKNNGYVPRGESLNRIATYFDVPTDFLLGNGAFYCWKEINANRKAFIEYAGISADKLRLLWGINMHNINTTPLHDFVRFISGAVKSVTLTADGDFCVELNEGFQNQKETPATADGDELNEYLEELKTRSEMRMLFSVSKNATKEDVMRAVAIIEALKKEDGE